MLIGILIIMIGNRTNFTSSTKLTGTVEAYFKYIDGDYDIDFKPGKTAELPPEEIKIYTREAEPPTIAGLTLFLGFNSRAEFDKYEEEGAYASVLKRARLRIETEYEKKLHYQSSAGAMFALKSMGWNDRPEDKPAAHDAPATIIIQIIDSGPKPAGNEQDVIL